VVRRKPAQVALKLPIFEAALPLSRHLQGLDPNRSDKQRNAEIQGWQRPSYRSRGDDLGLGV
jgi:hypothetical protein